MPIGERSWNDKLENYADSYTISVNGTTATAAVNQDMTQPLVIYGISITMNPSIGSGDVSFMNGPGTATAGTAIYRAVVPSAASQTYEHVMSFPRGVIFSSGIIVSATSVTGSINISFKPRYE